MRDRGVYCRVRSLLRVLSVALPCFASGLLSSPAFAQPSVQGQWVAPPGGDPPPYGWPVIAVDAALLSTGKVLVWEANSGDQHDAKLWNPADGNFTEVDCTACVGNIGVRNLC